MRKMSPSKKIAFASAAVLAAVLGTTAVVQSANAKGRPGGPPLLCGPTYQWSCSGPGGPDRLFIGTICEKMEFEAQTGLTCVPI